MAGPSPLVRRDNGQPVKDGSYTALGYRKATGAGAVLNLTSISGGVPAQANKALVAVEGATVRWTDDDTVPSSSVGMPIFADCVEWWMTDNLEAVKCYLPNGATMHVSFYA